MFFFFTFQVSKWLRETNYQNDRAFYIRYSTKKNLLNHWPINKIIFQQKIATCVNRALWCTLYYMHTVTYITVKQGCTHTQQGQVNALRCLACEREVRVNERVGTGRLYFRRFRVLNGGFNECEWNSSAVWEG